MLDMGVSNAVVGLANAGIVLVVYGLLGLAGIWFARKLGFPGIYSEDGNWRRWFFIPLLLGLVCGVMVIIGDVLFAPFNNYGRFVHPQFPMSIFASLSAGIGEEIMFRGFVFGLWGLLLNWLLKRFNGRTVALWIANLIAALAFRCRSSWNDLLPHRRFILSRTESCTIGRSLHPQRNRRTHRRRTLHERWIDCRVRSPLLDGCCIPCNLWIDVINRIFSCQLIFQCSHRQKAKRK